MKLNVIQPPEPDKNANVDNICASCPSHCCRYPLMIKEEVENMAKGLGCKVEDIPVKPSKIKHLDYLGLEFVEMNNPNTCFAFEEGKGCRLPHDLKPAICKLYPWIPYNFEGDEWELLLDVNECWGWKVWGGKYEQAMKEFKEIREKNPERWRTINDTNKNSI